MPMRRGLLLLVLLLLAVGCSRPATPTRKPDVPYEPSPHEVVSEMLRLARVGENDVVYDLGCGDGRIVIAAIKDYKARAGVCIDIDPKRIEEARQNATRAGVGDRVTFLNQDLFEADIEGATVVTLFLWPHVNLKLRPKLLRELGSGVRVVSYMHDMGDWKPDESVTIQVAGNPERLMLWTIPPK
jgi:SAM-dependent methyltransferase